MINAHDNALERNRLYTESECVEHARRHELVVFKFSVQRIYGKTGVGAYAG